MYYYIFEPSQGAGEYERLARIKEYLAQLGIAGEMSSPSPGRTLEDLVELAVAKRYSTIIAIGDINLVNKVARALEPYDAVFGIIPLQDHPDISQLIGVNTWQLAADQLKRRRFSSVRLGLMNKEIGFLTPAHLEIPSDQGFVIQTKQFEASSLQGGSIQIDPCAEENTKQLAVSINQQPPRQTGLLQQLFRRPTSLPTESIFRLNQCAIATEQPVSVIVAGQNLLQTPVTFTSQTKTLKLIGAKATET